MKTIKVSPMYLLMLGLLGSSLIAFAQTPEEAKLQRLELAVTNAHNKHAANERKLEIADSLLTTGDQMNADAELEFQQVEKDRYAIDKEYSSSLKSLTKLSNSKNADEAEKAKTDLKALELKYKSDTKELDNRLKAVNKKALTGQSNIDKGKEKKKAAVAALKESQAAVDLANENLDAAKNPDEEGSSEKK